ncbi:hypothetical protein DL765_004287 [Monosporascus sp. GIB2]|nr:hypothetical protein DL765_004287 [Monosporascus sp. GIB2]
MIHDNPELRFQEVIAHHTLTSFIRGKAGWKLSPSTNGMAAAWVAEFDTRRKGPVVSFNVEMGGAGKIKLLEAGALEYFGREAPGAANPWQSINELDALITAYNALSAAGNFVVRAAAQAGLEELKKKVDACFQAGATATAATLKMPPTQSYADYLPNRVLGDVYRRYSNMLSPPHLIPENDDIDQIRGKTMASTDQGNISYAMLSLHAGISIPPGPGVNGPHNPEFAGAAGTKVAFVRSLRVAKALTGVTLDVVAQNGLLE